MPEPHKGWAALAFQLRDVCAFKTLLADRSPPCLFPFCSGLVHGVAELVQLGCSGRAALSLLCPSLNVLTPQRAGTEEGVDVLACGWQHALMPAWL